VLFTTIYRTKGLEFDYVMIPGCNEGSMPMLLDELVPVFDKEGLVPSEPLSPLIERERRLFYVGVTRARKAVFISAGAGRSAADSHGSSEVVEPSRFLYEAGLLVKDSNGEGGDH
jgi:superfamily I DNA/RNA helicase